MGKATARPGKPGGARSLKQREGPAENRRHRNAVRAEQSFGKKAAGRKPAKKASGKGRNKDARQARPASGVSAPGQKSPSPRSAADVETTDSRGRFQAGPAIAPEGDWHTSEPVLGTRSPDATPAVKAPLIAIVGRPNVGKSTLFNRMTGSRRSIVGDEPGITRDRIYGEVEWAGRTARVVDTGGIVPDDEALIPAEIFRQARVALDEASALIMVVDGRTELASSDMELARLLIRMGKPLFLAVNKTDTPQQEAQAENFRTLGITHLVPISAEHSSGVGDLMDEVFAALPASTHSPEAEPEFEPFLEEPEPETPRERKLRVHGEFQQAETNVAIIGRPNVGKSTLLNALTGMSRAIVSPIAGTTRDAVDEVGTFDGHPYRFVDTAGIRRKGKTTLMAEKLSVVMARRHLEAADVAILLIDAQEGVTATDATIGGYAHESGRSIVIAVNKWDLVGPARQDGKPPADMDAYLERLRRSLKFLDYAPVVFLSAQQAGEGTRGARRNIERLMRDVAHVAVERRKRVSTGQMNRFLARLDFQRAPVPLANRMRIFFITQAAVAPPTFVLFTDRDVKLHFAFERFLENQLRAAFGFDGTPIWFKVRPRSEKTKDDS